MTETVFCVLGMVLCVCGAVGVIHWLALKLSSSNESNRIYAVLLKNEADIQLQMLIDTLEWDTALKYAKVYAIDGGLSHEMAEYCRGICKTCRITYLDGENAEKIKGLF